MALTAKKVYAILKRQISDMEAKLNSPVRYRGTVATADLLPLNPDIGDMYNIESKSVYGEAGMNVAWNGVVWDTMGAPIDMSLYLTKEEAETVIQRLVTEYFEKNPVKPGATTEQAQQIEQNKTDIASLKTETSSLKEDISNKITKFYASSQGETHLADSDDGKIMDMMLYGKSEQKQYSGKNLLKATLQTTTKNGVTCTANGDGTYTLNGTATERTEFIIDVFNIDISKKYKLIAFTKERSYINCFVQLNQSPWTIYGASTDSQVTITDSKNIRLVIAVIKGTTLSNEIIKPMVVDASLYPDATYDDFEPYTGGIPSPNPDYPQEIKSVVNPTVKVCGKNLLNYNAWKGTPIKRGTAIYENNGITLTATENDCYSGMGNNFPDNAKIKVSEGETLTLSWEQIENNKEGYIYIFGNGIASNSVNINNRKSKKLSYTVPSGVTFITFRFGVAATGDTISYKNIQIEKGSEATSYEPYHEQTVTLPYTLNAIPVSSGGNVTIDGQQYIADYVDVERGKLVRMCKEVNALDYEWTDRYERYVSIDYGILPECVHSDNVAFAKSTHDYYTSFQDKWMDKNTVIFLMSDQRVGVRIAYNLRIQSNYSNLAEFKEWMKSQADNGTPLKIVYALATPEEIDLTTEEIKAFKLLQTYYPTTKISINSEQLDGYTVFNYPISMENGWNYVKQQIGDTREYIYDMDARTQDMDIQSAEAYVNSEYAVALTELEV